MIEKTLVKVYISDNMLFLQKCEKILLGIFGEVMHYCVIRTMLFCSINA